MNKIVYVLALFLAVIITSCEKPQEDFYSVKNNRSAEAGSIVINENKATKIVVSEYRDDIPSRYSMTGNGSYTSNFTTINFTLSVSINGTKNLENGAYVLGDGFTQSDSVEAFVIFSYVKDGKHISGTSKNDGGIVTVKRNDNGKIILNFKNIKVFSAEASVLCNISTTDLTSNY
jgi:hypothetical protein